MTARHVEHVMGTVFSIETRTPGEWSSAFEQICAFLHEVDRVFSTYRDDSDIVRLRRRELRAADAHPWVRPVLELCADLQDRTEGWFSARYAGRIDPTGVVKGWAVERAATMLADAGSSHHLVNGGGDVQTHGTRPDGTPWQLAVVDPRDRSALLAVVPGSGHALATSGTAERGLHIVDPFTGHPVTGIASVSVTGPSVTAADAYATAAVARRELGWLDAIEGYEALLVRDDGTQVATRGWARQTRDARSSEAASNAFSR